jgi:hypothetical protein
MKRVLESQKAMMEDVLSKNSQLVTENSELRMHMSFIPVEYRDYVKNMQASNQQEYRKQRVTPRVIIPNADHKDGLADIQLEDALMSHPAVAFSFRDAQYTTLSEARIQMDKSFAVRERVTSEPYKMEAPWRVNIPPPPAPAPTPTPATRQRPNKADTFANAAYHQVMSSASTEPYAVPTTQRVPPPTQRMCHTSRTRESRLLAC